MRRKSRTKKENKALYTVVTVTILVIVVLIGIFFPAGSDADEKASSVYVNAQKSAGAVTDYSENGIAVHYIDVGQGDCELIMCGGQTMLIDAGEKGNEENVTDYLRQCGVTTLNYVVATHPHSDHIGSMAGVISSFKVENFIMFRLSKSNTPTTQCYSNLLDAVSDSGAKVTAAKQGLTFSLGDATVTILGPVEESDDLNNDSVILRVDYKNSSYLFEGDAEEEEEESVLESGADVDCDVLKVGHHGSKTSSSEEYLESVTPEIAVISCGSGNEYGHPHDAAVNRIKEYTDKIYRTDLCSDIVVASDGTEYNVYYNQEK